MGVGYPDRQPCCVNPGGPRAAKRDPCDQQPGWNGLAGRSRARRVRAPPSAVAGWPGGGRPGRCGGNGLACRPGDRRQSVHHQPDVDCGAGEVGARTVEETGGRQRTLLSTASTCTRTVSAQSNGQRQPGGPSPPRSAPPPPRRHRFSRSGLPGLGADCTASAPSLARHRRTPPPTPSPNREPAGGVEGLPRQFHDGRPVIFIGHSQGQRCSSRLLASQIDTTPPCVAHGLGDHRPGDVAVPTGDRRVPRSGISPCAPAVGAPLCDRVFDVPRGQPPARAFLAGPARA